MRNLTDYEKNDMLNALRKDLDYHAALLSAWQNVTRNYKKNGQPFANLVQNFSGLSVSPEPYSLHAGEKKLSVHVQSNMNGYISESISTTDTVKYTKFEVDESRIIKEPLLEPYFHLTLDEIQELINKQIIHHEEEIESLKNAIDNIDRDIDLMNNLLQIMDAEMKKMHPESAYKFRTKYIRNYY